MNEAAFFAAIRKSLFSGRLSASQVTGINGILQAMDEVGDGDQDTLAYALATAYHEVGKRMVPVREGFANTDAGARKAVNALARKRGPKSAVAKYSKPAGPYGHVYYARGHMGLTWLENYEGSSKDAGVDLVKNPDAMLDPVISARILIKGIIDGRWNGKGHGIDHYEGDDEFLSDAEAAEARRTINVKDKAVLIAGYSRKFYDALELAGWAKKKAPAPKPEAAPKPAPAQRKPANPPRKGSAVTDDKGGGATSALTTIATGATGGGIILAVSSWWTEIKTTLAVWVDVLTFWN